ncbi:MAG: metallophosphoesterase [Deltaproteobacteria bacterium]|jgi:predicted MPP superfamily phosphohydrolase|nr:metallophosphoesterase [Deltaproteobacteria bacterium]
MIANISLIIALYIFIRLILPLPLKVRTRVILTMLAILGTARFAIMRAVFGGVGAIEAPRWLLLSTSLFQGILLVLFLAALARDLVGLITLAFGPKRTKKYRKALYGLKAAIILAVISLFVSGLGLYGAAKVPEVKNTEVFLNHWPQELDGLKVAILADMHICKFFDQKWVQEVVDRTNAQKPDIIWLPGDMVDGTTVNRAPDVAPLAELKAPYGVYGIMGNHEYISGALEWLPVFRRLGIDMLYNSHVIINIKGASFILAGLTDLTAQSNRYSLPGPDLAKSLLNAPQELPIILLEHRPVRAKLNAAHNDRIIFQVSGHTHGGMVPILKTAVKRINGGFVSGFYQVQNLKLLVVPGLGLWSGFPMRILNPSEITFLTIRTGQAPA